MAKRKVFGTAYKARIAVEAIRGEYTINQIAGKYEVHSSQIAQWKKQAYVPKKAVVKQVHRDIADIFNANNRLNMYVQKYEKADPKLSEWMEENIPEGLSVFALPLEHRKRMRTSNMAERLHQEINRRTRVARLFPNDASLLRLVSAIEIEISEEWVSGRRYLDMSIKIENENGNATSENNRIYRRTVA